MTYFRNNTWDEIIWNDIVYNNEYGIHDKWPSNLIDIGGHIGSFSFKMLTQHQTKRVVIVEPNIDNYNLLVQNLEEFIQQDKVIAINKGIGPPNSKLNISNALGENTGGSFYSTSSEGVETVNLDSLIDIIDDGSPILLKIDCESCEYEALSSCTKLSKINCIVGEFHITPKFGIDNIKEILQDYNFSYHFRSDYLGLFGAHRS
jgi:FkbM family methyltransferase